MRSSRLKFLLIVLIISLVSGARFVNAQNTPSTDWELAERFAPVLYFHPEELFRPQSVDSFIQSARLRKVRNFWFDVNVINNVSIKELINYRAPTHFLDIWYGDEVASDSKNYTSHREYYEHNQSPNVSGLPVSAYVRINRSENPNYITIQYWLFYYYNDWFNKHEGDWEMVEVILDQNEQPLWVVLSQHHGGTRRSWDTLKIEEETHPAVYVALGSHANYFQGDEVYPNGMDIGSTRVEILDHTGISGRVIPVLELLPDPLPLSQDAGSLPGMEWIFFGGHWGETAQHNDFSGPIGPVYKGEQWSTPFAWGITQPEDGFTWYRQRLSVYLSGDGKIGRIMSSDQEVFASMEFTDEWVLFHRDLPEGEMVSFEIQLEPRQPVELSFNVPDTTGLEVKRYFYHVSVSDSNLPISVTLEAGELPVFAINGKTIQITPSLAESEIFHWNNPDLVWMPGLLPAFDLLRGLLICLLAGWLPALIFTLSFYWMDRFEKEPISLLAAAFMWGAIPALLISIVIRLFVYLPAELLGSNVIQAVWSGVSEPLVEETLKGIVIILIALFYRNEFDNVLDGIIYGALVGIGFAMNGNIISYMGSFLTRGFSGLSNVILGQGILYGVNHAFYSGIFGAGLGYARNATKRWQRYFIPILAFLAGVSAHLLHSYILNEVLVFNTVTVILSLIGLLMLVGVSIMSIDRQRRCLRNELVDVLPEDIYHTVISPKRRSYFEWRKLFNEGFSEWRRVRRFHRICAEFAFKRMQARLFPGDKKIKSKLVSHRDEIKTYLNQK